jgi:hypothetical protein
MKCWSCGFESKDPDRRKLSFRELCEKCHAALHCCCNCKHYKPGQPNDCSIPGTDFVSDRTAANFCEEFSLHGEGPSQKKDPNETARRLFGDSSDPSLKKVFDSLFKDPNSPNS